MKTNGCTGEIDIMVMLEVRQQIFHRKWIISKKAINRNEKLENSVLILQK